MHLSATEYSLFFALGNLLSIPLNVLYGYMMSKYGRRPVTMLVLASMVAGQVLSLIGVLKLNYVVLLVGEAILL